MKIVYFAYGSNMFTCRLRNCDRAPSAIPVGTGFIAGRRLTFDKVSNDGSGKCDAEMTSSPSDKVYGVLYEIDAEDKPSLDRAEGLGCGYCEDTVTVVTRTGSLKAITYLATVKDPALRPYHWYKALVIAGAIEHGLPVAYLEWLRTCESRPDPDAKRRADNEVLLFSTESHPVNIEADVWKRDVLERIPPRFHPILARRDGATRFVQELPQAFAPVTVASESDELRAWEAVGNFYRIQRRYYEALPVYAGLYEHMLLAQEQATTRYHKGMPLVWMSDCYGGMGYTLISRRYLMLTLVEDAIRESGTVSPDTTGIYFRLVSGGGLSDTELRRYAGEMNELWKSNPKEALYPEWVVQQLDRNWITQVPATQEVGVFSANQRYIRHLIAGLGEPSGKILELLADYLLSCMPGCRTSRRQRSGSTDYDIVCSMEGFDVDFRSELGRYFVCECKDWNSPADFSTMAKFCRVLDSVKSRFGILFSKFGITGEGKSKDAELEQLKVFQDRGMVIVVVNQKELEQIAGGSNFISLLRTKYERVRLNLVGGKTID
jgi:gamma-glutamylcyclotransferase